MIVQFPGDSFHRKATLTRKASGSKSEAVLLVEGEEPFGFLECKLYVNASALSGDPWVLHIRLIEYTEDDLSELEREGFWVDR
jgi:hypothetical protein